LLYFISFLEGIITFISPCLLPLLPVYVSYFAGGDSGDEAGGVSAATARNAGTAAGSAIKDGSAVAVGSASKAVSRALGFVLGFSAVFVTLGAFAGLLSAFLIRYKIAVNIVTGAIVIMFGLNYLGFIRLSFLYKTRARGSARVTGFFSAALFGVVFSLGWTPCVGAFLGTALMQAAHQGTAARGVLLLLCYSLGLGVPFIISAVFIESLKVAFDQVKKRYHVVNAVSGAFLIIIGILMATGMMGRLLSLMA